MGKITATRVYHVGIPVNDFERSKKFYVDLLGMTVQQTGTTGENDPLNQPFRDILGYWPETLRLKCANDDIAVVLVKRPKPIERDWKEDSFNHTAISATKEDFDRLLDHMKEWGIESHVGPIVRRNGRTIFIFDPDSNLIQVDDRG